MVTRGDDILNQIDNKTNDTAKFHEASTTTRQEIEYRMNLDHYFKHSIGSNVDKLQNFTKYVPRQTLTTFISKYEIFKQILNVHGSIIECGVLFGGGLMAWAQLSSILEPINSQRKVIGFDTFAGFKELSELDKKGTSEFLQEGGLAIDSYDDLQKCIELYDDNRFLNHIEKVSLMKGDINETVPKYLEENPHTIVSLLYLDIDVFKPTVVALKYFVPRMPKGAVIVFDELNSKNWPGETQALIEEIGIYNLKLKRLSFDSYISYAIIE